MPWRLFKTTYGYHRNDKAFRFAANPKIHVTPITEAILTQITTKLPPCLWFVTRWLLWNGKKNNIDNSCLLDHRPQKNNSDLIIFMCSILDSQAGSLSVICNPLVRHPIIWIERCSVNPACLSVSQSFMISRPVSKVSQSVVISSQSVRLSVLLYTWFSHIHTTELLLGAKLHRSIGGRSLSYKNELFA